MNQVVKHPLLDVAISYAIPVGTDVDTRTHKEVRRAFDQFINRAISYDDCAARINELVGTADSVRKVRAILETKPAKKFNRIRESSKSESAKKIMKLWTMEEDRYLLAAIHKYGLSNWSDVSEFVGNGRTRSQCSQRWYRGLDPRISKERWSDAEDSALLDAVARHGTKAWTKISKDVKTRCDVQCRNRYNQLKKGKKVRKIKEAPLKVEYRNVAPSQQLKATIWDQIDQFYQNTAVIEITDVLEKEFAFPQLEDVPNSDIFATYFTSSIPEML